ncbi:serine/threonine protein kinase [Piscirickettsia salmonis]|nr:serine/threonine protein kinase [Piscirickettsia salmonis]
MFDGWNIKLGGKGFMLHFIRKINSGRFGKVILVGDERGDQSAVKLFRQQYDQPGRVRSSAQIEITNFNDFSHRIQNIGRAEVMPITDIRGLAQVELERYDLEAMLMPYFHSEREVSYEEIRAYITDLAERNFFMGDPRVDNFFCTAEFGIIPIDFGLVFRGNSPLLIGDYRSAVIDAILNYPDVFGSLCMAETTGKYRELSEGRESALFRESMLFFDSETTVTLRLPESMSAGLEAIQDNYGADREPLLLVGSETTTALRLSEPRLAELEPIQEEPESDGLCCAVL